MMGRGFNLYWQPNPLGRLLDGAKASREDIGYARFAHLDLDPDCTNGYDAGRRKLLEEVVHELLVFAIKPSLIIDSGNGIQALWHLPDCDLDRLESVNRRLAARFGGDKIWNCSQLMRLPFTWNFPNAKKLEKGYPREAGVARILHHGPESYDPADLEALLLDPGPGAATVPPQGGGRAAGARKTERDFSEDQTSLTAEEIEALDLRLVELLATDAKFAARWGGNEEGLQDTSRSTFDFSMMALLKARGFAYREAVFLLRERFERGRGREGTDPEVSPQPAPDNQSSTSAS